VRTAFIPGSFDPLHNGHFEVIESAAQLFDRVIVAAMRNPGKGQELFSLEERGELIEESVRHLSNVDVVLNSKARLVVDLAREVGADVIVKGLRVASDFEYELQMAQMNRELANIETLFVPTAPQVGHLSSSLVKQIANFGGDVSRLVPKAVNDRLLEHARKGKGS
jgi:pantetheine-phosphate adenylyltransferase